MEDVIDVMEGLIIKVVEVESRKNESRYTGQSPDNINVTPVRNKDGVEVIILDDSLHKTFESPNEVNVQVDPLSIDTENVAIKKEPVTEMVDCKEVAIHEPCTEANIDDIDLAMEVVEEVMVDEVDQTINSEHKPNVMKDECKEQITEFREVVGDTKFGAIDDRCPQSVGTKMETVGYNGNGEDVGVECDDDVDGGDGDDEYDGDDDDDDEDDGNDEEEADEEEEETKRDVEREDLHGGSGMKSGNKTPKLPEKQPEAEGMKSVIPEASRNRRSSQESTTTTTTTTETSTANSSSSSSDSEGNSSSSNEDSSKSSSNSDSDNASDSNSEEAEQTAETTTRGMSAAPTHKKKNQVPSAAKREDVKKKHSNVDEEQDGNYGMYAV
jgi:hypothetical protein